MNKLLLTEEKDNICASLLQNKFNVICWQPNPTDPNNKIKYVIKLSKINSDENILEFKSRFNKTFGFIEGEVFFFCENLKLIFKADLFLIDGDIISVRKPIEIVLIQDELIVTLKEENNQITDNSMNSNIQINFNDASDIMGIGQVVEDEVFAHLRASPRSKVIKEQKVSVKFLSKEIHDQELDLLDLSRGGAGIVFKNTEFFEERDLLEIVKIDGKEINPSLKGEVMSVKAHDVEKGLFKAGIKFI